MVGPGLVGLGRKQVDSGCILKVEQTRQAEEGLWGEGSGKAKDTSKGKTEPSHFH